MKEGEESIQLPHSKAEPGMQGLELAEGSGVAKLIDGGQFEKKVTQSVANLETFGDCSNIFSREKLNLDSDFRVSLAE